jgi:hypothetical protein
LAGVSGEDAFDSVSYSVVEKVGHVKDALGSFEQMAAHHLESGRQTQHGAGEVSRQQHKHVEILQAGVSEHAHVLQRVALLYVAYCLLYAPKRTLVQALI